MIHDIFSKEKTNLEKKERYKIFVDYREKNSLVPGKLSKLGIDFELKELKIGDYEINETIVERKTVKDLIQSMINRRLKRQIEEIKQYPNYLLFIEGNLNEELKKYSNPNSIRGFLISVTLNHKTPIIYTENEEETAQYLKLIAKKEKNAGKINPVKKSLTKNEQLEFILQSFPKIGNAKSKKLLQKFKSLNNVFNSEEEKLNAILGKNSIEFKEILNREYK